MPVVVCFLLLPAQDFPHNTSLRPTVVISKERNILLSKGRFVFFFFFFLNYFFAPIGWLFFLFGAFPPANTSRQDTQLRHRSNGIAVNLQ